MVAIVVGVAGVAMVLAVVSCNQHSCHYEQFKNRGNSSPSTSQETVPSNKSARKPKYYTTSGPWCY